MYPHRFCMFRLEDCPFNIFRHDHIRQSLHVFEYIHTSILLGICLLRQYQNLLTSKQQQFRYDEYTLFQMAFKNAFEC